MNKYQYKVQGTDYEVEIVNVEGNIAQVNVNGISFEVEMKQPINPTLIQRKPASVSAPKASATEPTPKKEVKQAGKQSTGTKMAAPLPGTITEVKVKEGDTVKSGDTIIILEAMKMQNNIEAEIGGTITSVLVSKGDTVLEGDTLVIIG